MVRLLRTRPESILPTPSSLSKRQQRNPKSELGRLRWLGGRPALRGGHSGFVASSFVLGISHFLVQLIHFIYWFDYDFDGMRSGGGDGKDGIFSNASNLVMYVLSYLQFSPSKSSNTVTNFTGTAMDWFWNHGKWVSPRVKKMMCGAWNWCTY